MNIHTAAHYMKNGYRIRRPVWISFDYIFQDGINVRGTITPEKYEIDFSFIMGDLLADDWEIDYRDIVDDSKFIVQYKE